MKRMRKTAFAAALGAMASFSGSALAIDFSNCGASIACPYVTYGDGNSYSLSLNAYMWNFYQGGGTGPGNPFYVASGPGQISSLIVNATGSSGGPVTTNFPGMDNAYDTPSGTVNSPPFFSMNKTAYGITTPSGNPSSTTSSGWYPADPGGPNEFANDSFDRWDTTVAALKAFLGTGNTPVFFFNNNQVSSGAATNQNLAVWAQITLTAADGSTKFFDFTNYFYDSANPSNSGRRGFAPAGFGGGGNFNGDPANYTSTGAGPVAGDNASTDYVLSGGRLCISPPNPGGGQPYPGLFPTNPDGSCPTGTTAINNNLGANQAAYAVVFPELNVELLNGNWVTMSIDLRFGCDPNTSNPTENCVGRSANNGFEQLFIASTGGANVPPSVPEPATIALLGAALAWLGLARRRSRRAD